MLSFLISDLTYIYLNIWIAKKGKIAIMKNN